MNLVDLGCLVLVLAAVFIPSWHLILYIGPRRRTWSDQVGLSLAVTVAIITLTGLILARAALWSPLAMALGSALFAGAVVLTCWRNNSPPVFLRGHGGVTVAAITIAATFTILWGTYAHSNLLGERDEGVYMASAVELARTGDLGWPELLAQKYGFGAVFRCLEFLGLKYDGFPRLLLYPGFYIEEPGFRVIPQFLGGYEPWLALAYRAGGEAFLFRVNPVLMGLGLCILFAAACRLIGPWPSLGTILLTGACMGVSWSARSAGNEALTLPLIWGTILLTLNTLNPQVTNRALPWVVLPLLTAIGVTKIAGWFMMPVLAALWGYHTSRNHCRPALGHRSLLVLLLAGMLTMTHAAVYAPHYLHGTYKHGLAHLGVPYGTLVVGLPVLVVFAGVAGWLSGRFIAATNLFRPFRGLSIGAMVAVFLAAVILGRIVLWYQRQYIALSGDDAIWSNTANLTELANYLPTGLSLVGLAGLAWAILARKSIPQAVLIGIGTITVVMIWNRNIDSNHPWAGRRWVPVVFPACCIGIAFALHRLAFFTGTILKLPKWTHALGAGVLMLCATAIVARPGFPLLFSSHGNGLVEAHQSITKALPKNAVIFASPSTHIRAWLPWQYARHGIPGYVLQAEQGAWTRAMAMLKDLQVSGRTPVFVTDYPPAPWTLDRGFLIPVGTHSVHWSHQMETVRSLPTTGSEATSVTFHAYTLGKEGMRRGWTPWSYPPPPRTVHQTATTIPVTAYDIPVWPVPAELEGIFDGAILTDSPRLANQAWTGGEARIFLAEWIQSQIPTPATESMKPIAYEVAVVLSGGLFRDKPVSSSIDWNTFIPGKQRSVWSGLIGSTETTITTAIRADRLSPDSFLEIRSLRSIVEPHHTRATAGLRLHRLIVTPIFMTAHK